MLLSVDGILAKRGGKENPSFNVTFHSERWLYRAIQEKLPTKYRGEKPFSDVQSRIP